jgi:glycosyltransferase involved in cell wall biosynthesis
MKIKMILTSINGIVSALERLLVDGELWSRLSRNGLEFVKRFDHIEVAKRYLSIIGGLRER